DFRVCGDQPRALRSAGSRVRTGSRIPYRVQRDEIRHVFCRRILQHGDGCLLGDADVSWRLARADLWSAHFAGAYAGVLVLPEGFLFYVPVRLGALDLAPLSL